MAATFGRRSLANPSEVLHLDVLTGAILVDLYGFRRSVFPSWRTLRKILQTVSAWDGHTGGSLSTRTE
jgi:hypothetical protein